MAVAPDEKAVQMAKMTEEVRRTFALPESEVVIQDYHCSLFRTAVYVQGHMWITPGYLLFQSSVPPIKEQFAFRKITEIKKEKTQLVFPGVGVTFDGKQQLFSSFVHRDEAFLLIHYIWKHPIVYVNLDDGGGGFGGSGSVSPRPGSSAPAGSGYGNGGGFTSSGGGGFTSAGGGGGGFTSASGARTGGGGGQYAGGGQAFAPQSQVDTQTSRNLVRIANESRQMGIQTNTQLAQQAEQLDRVEYNLESINANLDKAERHLRGIHSIGGALKNHYTEDKTKNNTPVFNKQDRTLKVEERQLPDVEYDILYKHKDDSLSSAILRFGMNKWQVLDGEKKTPLKSEAKENKGVCDFPYDQVEKLVMRARPQHVDVRFKGSADKYNRIRLLTSDIQFICNEFFLRTKPNCPVEFEPGVRKFDYGSSAISKSAAAAGGDGGRAPQNAFMRTQQQAKYQPGNLMQNDANRTAMKQVDDDLDEVSGIVGDLKAIAKAQGTEIDRSIEHLDRLNIKADQTNQRIAANNKKIQYEIKHN